MPEEAMIIAPYSDLLIRHGRLSDMRDYLNMLHDVDPDMIYILVNFAPGVPGGLSDMQIKFLINCFAGPHETGMISSFYEHLCLDDDVRPWIDDKIKKGGITWENE